ncbi:hypothetical protein CCMA1212_010167 [Trichoderma ghanense]|uniref:SSCRP protein n=1 Tax=Trichoderma ghanense TaxID=65468 RepID=A0ABY2GS30_9HYPO
MCCRHYGYYWAGLGGGGEAIDGLVNVSLQWLLLFLFSLVGAKGDGDGRFVGS